MVVRRPIKGWKQQKKLIVVHTGGCFSFVGCYQPLFVCFNNQHHFSISTKYSYSHFIFYFFLLLPNWSQVQTTAETTLEKAQVIAFYEACFQRRHRRRMRNDYTRTDDRLWEGGKNNRWTEWSKPGGDAKKITVAHRTADAGEHLSEVWFGPLRPSSYQLIVAITFIYSSWRFFFFFKHFWAKHHVTVVTVVK